MTRLGLILATGWLCAGTVLAEAPKIDRSIGKEPAYRTKTPKYGLLVFGPGGKDRVWLVLDGDTLYVDRNGSGDLTESGKKVAAEKKPGQEPGENGYTFEVGELTVGGRRHKGLLVNFGALKEYEATSLGKRPDVQAVIKKDPKALAVAIGLDVEMVGLTGGGVDGRVSQMAGPFDLNGVLQFADSPAQAPVVHFAGPLEVTFYAESPSLRVGRSGEVVLVVGSPGIGAGTFAMLAYEETVPKSAKPMVEITFPTGKADEPRIKEVSEITGRC